MQHPLLHWTFVFSESLFTLNVSVCEMSQSAAPCCIDLTRTKLQLLRSCHSRSQWYSLLTTPETPDWSDARIQREAIFTSSWFYTSNWLLNDLIETGSNTRSSFMFPSSVFTTQWKFHKSCTHKAQLPGAGDVFSLCGGHQALRCGIVVGIWTLVHSRDRSVQQQYTCTEGSTVPNKFLFSGVQLQVT